MSHSQLASSRCEEVLFGDLVETQSATQALSMRSDIAYRDYHAHNKAVLLESVTQVLLGSVRVASSPNEASRCDRMLSRALMLSHLIAERVHQRNAFVSRIARLIYSAMPNEVRRLQEFRSLCRNQTKRPLSWSH